MKHWLPQWSGHGERTSGDGDDIINATAVTAEPFDIDEAPTNETDAARNETIWNESSGCETERHGAPEGDPPGRGGRTAGETDGNDNETKLALGITQDGPPGNLSHNETKVNATLAGSLGSPSYNETKANATQDALPGNQSHSKTTANATQGGPPENLSHNLEASRTTRRMSMRRRVVRQEICHTTRPT